MLHNPLTWLTWIILLLISDLPNILLVHFTGTAPAWLAWTKSGMLAVCLVLCWMWKPVRALWQFALVFLVFSLANQKGESWRVFGWIFTAGAAVAIIVPLVLSTPLTAAAFSRSLPLLPVAILLAALNAFAEEMYFRAPLLATLAPVLGKTQALLLACVFFGMAHVLYGSPPGLLGFGLTAFLAFLLGKSMLETRGIGWAWVMHFVPDVFIFFSYAMTW